MQGVETAGCVHDDIELATCDLYHQFIVCSICVKEPMLVRYFSASDLSDKHAVTILNIVFGCYTACSHLIIGVKAIIQRIRLSSKC